MTDWPSFGVQLGTGLVTLAALVVAIVGTYRATAQAKRSQDYIERRDDELEQREANAKAVSTADLQATKVFVRTNWTWEVVKRPWLQLSITVVNEHPEFVEILQVELDPPFRHNAEQERAIVFQAERTRPGRFVSSGDSWDMGIVQVYLEESLDLPSPPPVTTIFRDRFGNKWRLESDHGLTLLTPRRIVSLFRPSS